MPKALPAAPYVLRGAVIGPGIVGAGAAFLIDCQTIERLGALRASGATGIAPVVAVIIGALACEAITAVEILAVALILGGVVLIQTGTRLASRPRHRRDG